MKKYLIIVFGLLLAFSSFAHQPDLSTTMLVEKEDNKWVLQISAALTAFQHEVKTHFAETPYETPEEFQHMVLEHVENNLIITCNGKGGISLDKGMVQLGHETKVVFEVLGLPSDIETVRVINTSFKEINRNQSALIILKDGFKRQQFLLNDTNDHEISLIAGENEFTEMLVQRADFSLSKIALFLLAFILLSLIFLKAINERKKLKKPSYVRLDSI